MSTPRKDLLRARTTVPLTGTLTRPTVLLSFESDLSLKYASLWLTSAGSLKMPVSGIVRRALAVYMKHLDNADPAAEVRAVQSGCTSMPTDADTRQMALLRLYACAPGERLPPFRDIERSPVAGRRMAELTAEAEAMADALIRARPFRRRPGASV